jgi:hypothetical protein
MVYLIPYGSLLNLGKLESGSAAGLTLGVVLVSQSGIISTRLFNAGWGIWVELCLAGRRLGDFLILQSCKVSTPLFECCGDIWVDFNIGVDACGMRSKSRCFKAAFVTVDSKVLIAGNVV